MPAGLIPGFFGPSPADIPGTIEIGGSELAPVARAGPSCTRVRPASCSLCAIQWHPMRNPTEKAVGSPVSNQDVRATMLLSPLKQWKLTASPRAEQITAVPPLIG